MLEHAGTAVLRDIVTTLGNQNIDGLAGINRRTAADGDNGVALFLTVNAGDITHHGGGGVWRNIIIDGRDFQPAFLTSGDDGFQQTGSPYALVGYDHRPSRSHACELIGNVFKCGLAGNDFHRAEELIIFSGHHALAVSTKLVATFR